MLFEEILLPITHPKMFQDRAYKWSCLTNTPAGRNCCSWRRELEEQGQVESWLESLHWTGGGAAELSCFKVDQHAAAAAAAMSQLLRCSCCCCHTSPAELSCEGRSSRSRCCSCSVAAALLQQLLVPHFPSEALL